MFFNCIIGVEDFLLNILEIVVKKSG